MADPPDPYKTLGLGRGASIDEVRRAYRRLAKANHPDAAGEAALPRFLAIRAAYDQIVGPGTADGGPGAGTGRRGAAGARRAWDADPDRADATHRAYGRARRPRPSGSRPTGGPRTRPSGPEGATGSGPDPARPAGPAGPDRPPNLATPGSTSYDGADADPFEPDWAGASWYGTTSGTYWTLNPKEYADPRKHGPEYQARARRAAVGPADGPADVPADVEGSAPTPAHTTASWWDATAGPGSGAEPEVGTASAPAAPAAPAGLVGRIGRAVVGWLPIALGIGWFAGELSGCARFSADCDAGWMPIVWLATLAVLALLFIVPRFAVAATVAALAMLVTAVPGALYLASTGEGPASSMGAAVLGGLLVVGWVVGFVIGLARAMRRGSGPVS